MVASLLADSELRYTQEYISRGRALENIPLNELNRLWAGDFKSWLAEGDPSRQQAFNDADAELRLRSAPVPDDLVAAYWPQMKARVERVRSERFEEIQESLAPDIERLLDAKKN